MPYTHLLILCCCCFQQVGDSSDNVRDAPKAMSAPHTKHKRTSVHENLNSSELFNLYNMLNGVKTDLLWGRNSEEQPEETLAAEQKSIAKTESSQSIVSDASSTKLQPPSQQQKGHIRRPSTASVASSNSSTNTLSDSDSDISNENDSGIESETNNNNHEQDKSIELAKQYRTHLLGLYRCLEQMTEAANYLTTRYQSDVGPV